MPGEFGLRVAMWFAGGCFVLAAACLAGMIIHDWFEERRRKRRIYHATVPPPHG